MKELREELHARGIFDTDKVKKELQEQLSEVLKGAQRVHIYTVATKPTASP